MSKCGPGTRWCSNFSAYSKYLTTRKTDPKRIVRIRLTIWPFARSDLRRSHRQRHRQRAADQHAGVERAERDVQVVAAEDPRLRVQHPVEDVDHEHATEEHDLGDEEHPHAERGRLELLLHAVEVVLQIRVVRVLAVRACCRSSRRRRRRRRSGPRAPWDVAAASQRGPPVPACSCRPARRRPGPRRS